MIKIFKALSDENRLRIIFLLWENESCVCTIEKALRLSQSNASRHLSVLRNAGLITAIKRPPWVYYRLSDELLCKHSSLYEYLGLQYKKIANPEEKQSGILSGGQKEQRS